MWSITHQHQGKYTYLYASTAFRNEKGKPDNRRKRIGKVEPDTGRTVYDRWFLRLMEAAGTPLRSDPLDMEELPSQMTLRKAAVEVLENVKSYGAYYLLMELSSKIGLMEVLHTVFQGLWQIVFNIACYMVVEGSPMLYCRDWIQSVTNDGIKEVSSQRISELLDRLSEDTRNKFYQEWMNTLRDIGYLALDITSSSSYSQLMLRVENGYNRDKEKLRQVNFCLIMGEDSKLPVYQLAYAGSIKDVSTLVDTLTKIRILWPNLKNMQPKIVMDKGFWSTKNVNHMLQRNNPDTGFSADDTWLFYFLIAVPFTCNFAKDLIRKYSSEVRNVLHAMDFPEGSIRGMHKLLKWPGVEEELHTFLYFNPHKAQLEEDKLYREILLWKEKIERAPKAFQVPKKLQVCFDIQMDPDSKDGLPCKVKILEEGLKEVLLTKGWLIIIGNELSDPREALEIYRKKDVVEKGHESWKNELDLHRLRVENDDRADSKQFLAFISLIMRCAVDKVMKKENLYKDYTMKELFLKLGALKMSTVFGEKLLQPISKAQREIFRKFGIASPDLARSKGYANLDPKPEASHDPAVASPEVSAEKEGKPSSEKKPRKVRSDKGGKHNWKRKEAAPVKEGTVKEPNDGETVAPLQVDEVTAPDVDPNASPNKKKRKTRSDKGKKHNWKVKPSRSSADDYPSEMPEKKRRRTRSDKGKHHHWKKNDQPLPKEA